MIKKQLQPTPFERTEREIQFWLFAILALFYIVTIALIAIIPNPLNDYFQRATLAANVVGIGFILGSAFLCWNARNKENMMEQILAVLIVLLMGIFISCGLDVSLLGLKP